jgi:GGDEF domain-containing protein
LVAVSIDFLNELNLIGGWIIGDLALCGVAAVIETRSEPGALVGRVSGDAFMMLKREHRLPQVRADLRRIAEAVATLDVPGAESLPAGRLTLSIGMFCNTIEGVAPERAMDEARRRMDAACRQGGDRIAAIPENHSVSVERRQRISVRVCSLSPTVQEDVRLLELSMKGIALATRTPWLVRQTVSIELENETDVRFTFSGEIVWRKPAENRGDGLLFTVGIRFQSLDSERTDALEILLMGADGKP